MIPHIIKQQKNIKKDIKREEHLLNSHISKREQIEQQLDAFDRHGSLWASVASKWARVKGVLHTDCSKKDLCDQKRMIENQITNIKNRLKYLYEQNRIYDAHIKSAQCFANNVRALDESKAKQETQNNVWQELGISSAACTLINNANVIFAQFEQLPTHAQKEIIDLLNRGAYEQKNSEGIACDNIIITTVKVADTACQAYHKGHNELGSALINFGNTILDCTAAFSKGFVHGVGNGVKNNLNFAGNAIMHPLKTLEGVANGVVNAANFVLKHDGPLVALSLCPANSIIALGNNIAGALADTAQKLSKMKLVDACEKIGEMTGEFGADLVILDGALKGASIVKNIVVAETVAIIAKAEHELSAAGKLTKAERTALVESETLVVNAEKDLTRAIETEIAETLSHMDKKRIQNQLCEQAYVDAQEVIAKNKADQLAADIIKEDIIEGKEPFKFVDGALDHIMEPHRKIPIATIQDIIQNPMHVINDPRGTSASKYFSQIWKDGKIYNAELVFDKSTNEILHFLYTENAIGPLTRIK